MAHSSAAPSPNPAAASEIAAALPREQVAQQSQPAAARLRALTTQAWNGGARLLSSLADIAARAANLPREEPLRDRVAVFPSQPPVNGDAAAAQAADPQHTQPHIQQIEIQPANEAAEADEQEAVVNAALSAAAAAAPAEAQLQPLTAQPPSLAASELPYESKYGNPAAPARRREEQVHDEPAAAASEEESSEEEYVEEVSVRVRRRLPSAAAASASPDASEEEARAAQSAALQGADAQGEALSAAAASALPHGIPLPPPRPANHDAQQIPRAPIPPSIADLERRLPAIIMPNPRGENLGPDAIITIPDDQPQQSAPSQPPARAPEPHLAGRGQLNLAPPAAPQQALVPRPQAAQAEQRPGERLVRALADIARGQIAPADPQQPQQSALATAWRIAKWVHNWRENVESLINEGEARALGYIQQPAPAAAAALPAPHGVGDAVVERVLGPVLPPPLHMQQVFQPNPFGPALQAALQPAPAAAAAAAPAIVVAPAAGSLLDQVVEDPGAALQQLVVRGFGGMADAVANLAADYQQQIVDAAGELGLAAVQQVVSGIRNHQGTIARQAAHAAVSLGAQQLGLPVPAPLPAPAPAAPAPAVAPARRRRQQPRPDLFEPQQPRRAPAAAPQPAPAPAAVPQPRRRVPRAAAAPAAPAQPAPAAQPAAPAAAAPAQPNRLLQAFQFAQQAYRNPHQAFSQLGGMAGAYAANALFGAGGGGPGDPGGPGGNGGGGGGGGGPNGPAGPGGAGGAGNGNDPFQAFIGNALQSLTSAATARLQSALLSGMRWPLEQMRNNLANHPQHAATLGFITDLLGRIGTAQQTQSVAPVIEALQEGFRRGISLGGIPMPFTGPSNSPSQATAKGKYDQIDALLDGHGQVADKVDYDGKIQEQRTILVENTSRFTALITVDGLFNLGLNTDDYLKWMKEARNQPGDVTQNLREIFFNHLDKLETVVPFKKTLAKIFYRFFAWLLPSAMNETTGRFVDFAKEQVKANAKDGFKRASGSTLVNIRDYLSTLKSAFKTIPNNTEISKRLDILIADELKKPGRNEGFTQKEIHDGLAKVVVEQFAPRFTFASFGSTLMKPIENIWGLNLLGQLFSGIWYTVFYLFERLANYGLHKGLSKAIIKRELVTKIMTSSLKTLNYNAYMHAINKGIFLENLRKIWKLMRDGSPEFEDHLKKQQLHEKQEFTGLVKDLVEVLELSKCQTVPEVERLMKNPSLLQQAHQGIDDLFIKDTVESAARLIFVAWDAILNKEEINKQLYILMQTVNDSFDEGKDVDPAETKAVENEITLLKENITNFAIRNALEEKFEFSGKKSQALGTQYAANLQTGAQNLVTDQRRLMGELSQRASARDFVGTRHVIMQAVQNLINHLEQGSNRVDSARALPEFTSDLRVVFGNSEGRLDQMTAQIQESIARMSSAQSETLTEQQRNQFKNLFTLHDHLTFLAESLDERFLNLNSLSLTENKISTLIQRNPELREFQAALPGINAALRETRLAREEKHRFLAIQKWIDQLAVAKKQQKATTALEQHVRNEINTLTNATYKQTLLTTVTRLMGCRTVDEVNMWEVGGYTSAKQEIANSLAGRINQAKQPVNNLRHLVGGKLSQGSFELSAAAAATIQREVLSVTTQLNQLQQWAAAEVRAPETLHIPLDFGWFQDIIMRVASSQVRDRVDGLFAFASKPYNIESGLNRIAIIPLIKSFGVKPPKKRAQAAPAA
jgi:hypothetical protein